MDTPESNIPVIPVPSEADVAQALETYAQLSQEYQAVAAPRLAAIKALEATLAEETAHLTAQMQTLEASIKPAILAAKQSRKHPFVTVIYQPRDKWDRDILFSIAQEVPAVLTAYQDASFVQFRKTSH
jgi:hypothetical protein